MKSGDPVPNRIALSDLQATNLGMYVNLFDQKEMEPKLSRQK